VWLTGLPSAGKSSISLGVAGILREQGRPVEVLDGDAVRESLINDLGFSRADREENVRRITLVAQLLAKHGMLVLVPVIAPYAAGRDRVRAAHLACGTDPTRPMRRNTAQANVTVHFDPIAVDVAQLAHGAPVEVELVAALAAEPTA